MSEKTATERLREMLDERGVEWTAPNSCLRDEMTSWAAGGFDYETFEVSEPGGTFLLTAAHQDDLTPKQAIAATLGRPTFDANLEQALSFMRIWISDDAHLGDSELSAAFEKAEGLRKLDAIESAIAATLGGGKLTAEQVRKAIEENSWKEAFMLREFNESSWQAIADELNAALGGGECEVELRESGWGGYTRHCGACGADLDCDTRNKQNYCPNCGRKVKR